ncbi:MAG: DNA polymerase III subunit gamma/tau [Deltaproteobacteria bacterium]|nr:MAG: DNA polymerase III subunit gamma/tau [Deltaproteobacteria bacterium]UCH08363.1 MAG: DNA polymerase III subunit gamma/tau [Deltaproteobacteria bacterium]
MPYEVFARKWRPQLFEEVLGQEHITQTLQNAILSGRLAHAYLFSGARGVGKTSVARIFAKALNCEQGGSSNPCNQCTSCTEITNSSSVDVQEIDGASNRGIDEIRNLRENIRYLPSHGKYRIYIIDEVHMLTLPAFNALLKTLEEPPEHAKFVFATTEPHKVPVTILSRCQRFDFKRIPIKRIEEQLKKIITTEEITISDTGISIIAREAEGSMRDAESLLDQVVSFTGRSIEDSQIGTVLGIIDRDLIYMMSRAIIDGDNKGCLEIVDQIYTYGYEIKEFYREIMNQFRNLIVSLIAPDSSQLLDLPDNELTETKRLARKAGMGRLVQSLNFLIGREADLRYTNNPRIALEAILIRLSQLKDYLSFDELIKKIEDIEKRIDTSIATGPSVGRAEIPTQTGAEPKPADQDDGKKWDDFLRYVAKKDRAMANVLKEWKSYTIQADRLELPNGEGSFTAGYFDDPEHHEQLLTYAQEFFDPSLKVIFTKQSEPVAGKNNSKEETLPAAAQDIIDLFEGKIVNRT